MNYIFQILILLYKYRDWIPTLYNKPVVENVDKLPEVLNKHHHISVMIDKALMKSAIEHANWMDSIGRVTHIGEHGKTHGYRTIKNKYSGSYVAEYLIIYSGDCNEEIVNILSRIITSRDPRIKFNKIGYGRKNKYWCFLLGK